MFMGCGWLVFCNGALLKGAAEPFWYITSNQTSACVGILAIAVALRTRGHVVPQ